MKRLLVLCAAILLLLAACTQAPAEPATTLVPTEVSSEATVTTTEPVTVTPDEVQFTVTQHQLFPPKQAFDAGFEAFYNEFTAAVRGKDMNFIDGILDDGVMSSFGGDPGKEYFYEHWKGIEQHYGKSLWDELEAIIALGGVYYQAEEYSPGFGECFVAPYTFTDFRNTGLDSFEHHAIIAKDVPIYENASTGSKIIGTLDYSILEYHYNESDMLWEKSPEDFVSIKTLSGAAGYVQWKYFRSPIDYRLCIEQKDGKWKLLWLIAGD